jgi:ABC-type nitrate/sulfonate/bicarbonate transport system substrate-binding protein
MVITRRAALLAPLLIPAAARALSARPAPLSSPVALSVGAAKVAHLAPMALIGDDLKAMGVELKVVDFVRYADARTALASGSLDLATVGPADLPIAISQGITTIVALMGVGSQPKYPVVRNGIKVEAWKDLEGKTVAVAPASAVWFQFVATLQEVGLEYGKLKVVNIQGAGSNFDQALQRGDVDAIISWEPFESIPVAEGYGYWPKALDYSKSRAVGAELGMFAATRAAVTDKRAAVERFIWAYVNAQQRLAASPPAFASAITAYTGIAPAIAGRIAENIHLGAVLSLDQMQRQAKEFHRLGVIQRDVAGELPKFYAGDLVETVLGG